MDNIVTFRAAQTPFTEGQRQMRQLLNWLATELERAKALSDEMRRVSNFQDPINWDRMKAVTLQKEIRSILAKRKRTFKLIDDLLRDEVAKAEMVQIGADSDIQKLRNGAMAALEQRLLASDQPFGMVE